jgi:hypothetical protein
MSRLGSTIALVGVIGAGVALFATVAVLQLERVSAGEAEILTVAPITIDPSGAPSTSDPASPTPTPSATVDPTAVQPVAPAVPVVPLHDVGDDHGGDSGNSGSGSSGSGKSG